VSLEDLLSIKQVGAPQVAPDGRAVLYTVRGWESGTGRDSARKDARTHVWRVNTDGTGQRQMTYSERGETSPAWSPDGKFVSFLSARPADGDRAADEAGPMAQIWLMRADGGEAWVLTHAKEAITSYAWSPDSTMIAFVSRDALPKDVDDQRKKRDDENVFEGDFRLAHIWAVIVASGEALELTHDEKLTVSGTPSWSADSRRIVFSASPTPMIRDGRADIYIATHGSLALEKISTNPGPDRDPVWSPDGGAIAYVAGFVEPKALGDGMALEHIGNDHLTIYDVATKKTRDASSTTFDNSPGQLHWSADGKRLIFSTGVKTAREIFSFELATSKYTQLTHGVIANVGSVGKDAVALVMETSLEPPEIYIAENAPEVRLKPDTTYVAKADTTYVAKADTTYVASGFSRTFTALRKLTDTNPHARSFALGKSEVISWKSDNVTIEGVLLKPVNYQEGKRYPLMVVAHGGPAGAYVDNYRVGYGDGSQNWAGEGWAVLYPNPRGSSNYGEKFLRANINDWGGGDYRDIMAGTDAVIAKGIADPDRLAFQGWSYGGYMTAWVVSQTSRFKAAMMGAGLTSLMSMYGTNDIPSVLGAYFGGIPSKETMGLYMERSGITHIDRVTTPLLILHGGNDQRVPIGQPMEFYRALKDRGKATELVFYPREGHGFTEYFHQLDRLQRQHEWIARYTLGASARKSTAQ
jgi:dipeptidyl aminopeptidase/acylaminoacyl peptidase